ncbi:hypothetical protein [Pediococcus pentosaceus]|uniref:hypothetical protein n=1 Tax=Pediococcus pentosaceus TaxID=1255 RepID=UPI001E4DF350|nr:hypothetical protein [Pediococcus pentosaceus]
MAKKTKKHSWLKWSIGTWAGFKGVEYLLNHPHFIRDFKISMKEYFTNLSEFVDSLQSLKANSAQLQVELKKLSERLTKLLNRWIALNINSTLALKKLMN